jgi:hypothetical protein
MKKSIVVTLSALCLLFLPKSEAGVISPGVIPPNAKVHGKSYSEWSAAWWQWALALPADRNPFFDEGFSFNGANGQSGHVWFLAGVINESGVVERTLIVPQGTMLFFPVINTECSTLEVGTPFFGSNEQELRDGALGFELGNLVADIDGVPVANLERYMVASPLYSFTVPEDNVLGVPAGSGLSVANGVYLMLSPLPLGPHTIHFGGTYLNFDFTLDITYHIIVKR